MGVKTVYYCDKCWKEFDDDSYLFGVPYHITSDGSGIKVSLSRYVCKDCRTEVMNMLTDFLHDYFGRFDCQEED